MKNPSTAALFLLLPLASFEQRPLTASSRLDRGTIEAFFRNTTGPPILGLQCMQNSYFSFISAFPEFGKAVFVLSIETRYGS